jgi:hypothetical protein
MAVIFVIKPTTFHPVSICYNYILGWIQIRIRGSMPLTNLYHFSKIKSQKESKNRRNQGFSHYFCMMIEGSGSGSRAGSGSGFIPLTSGSGSGSGRPKNMWIRWIRIRWIRIRIRIRNTGYKTKFYLEKYQYGYKKNAEFYADFKFIDAGFQKRP